MLVNNQVDLTERNWDLESVATISVCSAIFWDMVFNASFESDKSGKLSK